MPHRVSAGLLMYRIQDGSIQVFLVHPGGPYFRNKDDAAWSIPKGEIEPDEDALNAAKREFEEEIGFKPLGPFTAMTGVKQKGGKVVLAWAFQRDCNPQELVSNVFTMEWPPKSGQQVEFPEIDKAEFFDLNVARIKINPAQEKLIDELEQLLGGKGLIKEHEE